MAANTTGGTAHDSAGFPADRTPDESPAATPDRRGDPNRPDDTDLPAAANPSAAPDGRGNDARGHGHAQGRDEADERGQPGSQDDTSGRGEAGGRGQTDRHGQTVSHDDVDGRGQAGGRGKADRHSEAEGPGEASDWGEASGPGETGGRGGSARPGGSDRLAWCRNPVRMFGSAAPWRATAYLASYLPLGIVFFAVCLVVLLVSAVLNITWLGLPLLIGAAAVVRGCARVERVRAGLVGPVIPAVYRPILGTGVFTHLRTRWHDPATWRDCAYLLALFPVLLVADVVGLVVWLACLAGVTVPVWYWSVTNRWDDGPVRHGLAIGVLPDGPDGTGGFGIWVGSLPAALVTALVSVVLSLLACYLVVALARLHRALARLVLGPYVDPLADAKRILAGPGPLPTH